MVRWTQLHSALGLEHLADYLGFGVKYMVYIVQTRYNHIYFRYIAAYGCFNCRSYSPLKELQSEKSQKYVTIAVVK